MARYIDADALIAEYDRVHVGAPGGARKLMIDAPTADVVPKTEVAMEIFEEIEKAINNLEYQTNYKRKTVPIQTMTDVVNWVLHEVVPETIAKLKKKYTEDQT